MKVGTLEDKVASNEAPALNGNSTSGKLGLSFQEITPQLSRQLGLKGATSGVVITQVQPDSPAGEAGLRQGDVIQEVNRQPVKSASDFRNAVAQSNKPVLMLVQREDNSMYVVIERNG